MNTPSPLLSTDLSYPTVSMNKGNILCQNLGIIWEFCGLGETGRMTASRQTATKGEPGSTLTDGYKEKESFWGKKVRKESYWRLCVKLYYTQLLALKWFDCEQQKDQNIAHKIAFHTGIAGWIFI